MHGSGTAEPILLVAASGLAREAAAAARAAGRPVLGCLDDSPGLLGSQVGPGLTVLGSIDDVVRFPDAALLVCAGRGAVRAAIVERLAAVDVRDERYATLVHPAAVLPEDDGTCVGCGSILLAGTVLTATVTVGRHVVCMPHAVLTHDCVVADYATICAGVVLGGRVSVGRDAYLGMASSVRQELTVGDGATIGMGAVALRDVPPGETWVGVPARPVSAPPPATTPAG